MSLESAAQGSEPTETPRRKRNHAIWLAPLIVFVGAISYFMYFVQFPALRDVPWLNLPVVVLGVLVGVCAVWRAFAKPDVYRGKILGSLSLVFSLLLAGLFGTYIVYFSYQMPQPTSTSMELDIAPAFTLNDQDAKPVSLSDFSGKKLIMTFYRGHW